MFAPYLRMRALIYSRYRATIIVDYFTQVLFDCPAQAAHQPIGE